MSRRIAVLGGGILGACTALELARRGRRVVLVERSADLIQGASRWNEGKIHLGFLYAADPSLSTAERLLPGGLAFAGIIERLVGQSIQQFATDHDDSFLVHRGSVVGADDYGAYASRTAELVRAAAETSGAAYFTDLRRADSRRLTAAELAELTSSPDVVAGFRVPERSVSTVPIADLLCRAVRDESRVDVHCDTWVTGVQRRSDGRFELTTNSEHDLGSFDVVVNALWEGRLAVDATLGIVPPSPWTHRFRAALFGRVRSSTLRSATLCTGPFGDVKRYPDGRAYLSWYEAGLIAEGDALAPPRDAEGLTRERRDQVLQGTLSELQRYFPSLAQLEPGDADLEVHGGWVYAVGRGSLADRASTLHQRDKFGIVAERGYISVDTAKYSIAPWLALRVADLIDEA